MLDILEQLIKKYPSDKQRHCVLITHVLPTAENYVKLIHEVFKVVLVIAIPYSSDILTIERLRSFGIPVYLPKSIEETFQCSGQKILNILQSDPTPLVVQEVGGYLAKNTEQFSQFSHFLGIVEDTNNGHYRYQAEGLHRVPVVSIAQSPVKDIEDTTIGDAVIYSTERIFREEFRRILQGIESGVIGYGKIGCSTAIALKGRESLVTVYDIDPARCIRARFEGHRIAPLRKILSESDLIVGCTGKMSVKEDDILYIRNGAVLVSASTKKEEFDLEAFEKKCVREEIHPVIWRYIQEDGRYFYLLNQGTPVNFRDQSILGSLLDLIYSELFLCMYYIAYSEVPSGLQHDPVFIQNEVAKSWLERYNSSFASTPICI